MNFPLKLNGNISKIDDQRINSIRSMSSLLMFILLNYDYGKDFIMNELNNNTVIIIIIVIITIIIIILIIDVISSNGINNLSNS